MLTVTHKTTFRPVYGDLDYLTLGSFDGFEITRQVYHLLYIIIITIIIITIIIITIIIITIIIITIIIIIIIIILRYTIFFNS